MSNIERFENLKQIIQIVQPQFDELARIHSAVNYTKEASFALQVLQDNQHLATVAMGEPDSLKRAVINVAAIGLSLNPILKLAYLIPRNKKVVLDISYLGYIQLAQEIGAVKWVSAEIVREKDVYEYQGMAREPIHKFNPFGERGEVVGAYCLAKTHDGEFILTQMPAEEILAIRDRSESWKAGKNSPWKSDESEMIKKTVIRRAYKSWPKVDTRDARFSQAIDVANDLDFSPTPALEAKESEQSHQIDQIRVLLKALDRTEEKYAVHISTVVNREIKKLEDLTEIELNQAIIMLEQFVEAKKQKEKKHENVS